MRDRAIAQSVIAVHAALLVACGAAEAPSPRAQAAPQATPGATHQVFADTPAEYVFTDPERRKKIEAAFPEIDRMVEAEMAFQKLPGMVFGVVVDGEMPYAKGFGVTDLETKGTPDADTVYRVGSITKSVTALAVLSLRDEGKLALVDPLSRWIPEADGLVYPTRDAPRLNLLQLLTHTSGLPEFGGFDLFGVDHASSELEIVSSLSGTALDEAPGMTSAYSNLGYALLGIVSARAAQAPFREIVHDRILAPLGMRSTEWDAANLSSTRLATPYVSGPNGALTKAVPWRFGASEGAGGLFSTLRDMGRYVAFQLAAYPPRSAPETGPIRRSSVREAHQLALGLRNLHVSARENAAKGESSVDARSEAYGFGWQVITTCDFEGIVQHAGHGEGSITHVAFLPERGVGIVAMTNVNGPHVELRSLAERALRAMGKTGGLPRRTLDPRLATPFGPAMQRFLGVYNEWDDPAYAAMLAEGRPRIPRERAELAGYHALHGRCSGYVPLEVVSRDEARFLMSCERGRLELQISFDPKDHLILGFDGTSRDVPIPPQVATIASRVTGLIGRWDEGTYTTHLAPKATMPRAETVAFLERLRARHGACSVGSYSRGAKTHEFALGCDKGGDLRLTLAFDEGDEDALATFRIEELAAGSCPVK